MALWRATKQKIRASVAPTLFLAITCYFGWNATQGALGLRAYALRQTDLEHAQKGLARAQSEEAAWARRVAALETAKIDADALDERARAVLNLADPKDIVVPYAKEDRLF